MGGQWEGGSGVGKPTQGVLTRTTKVGGFFDLVFGCILEVFWERLGLHLRVIMGSFGVFVRSKRALGAKTLILMKT